MEEQAIQLGETYVLDAADLQHLLNNLLNMGYSVVGPTIRDEAIVYGELNSISDLPIGMTDNQDAGTYRLEKREDGAFFGYAVGQHSWKQFLHPPSASLWEAKRKGNGFHLIHGNGEVPKYAFMGVRPCDLHAIEIHDKIFIDGDYKDHIYESIRENALIIVVNCTQPGGTCFCASMDTGPRAKSGFDLALTEILEKDHHYFLVEIGNEAGIEVFKDVPIRPAGEAENQAAEQLTEKAIEKMGRTLDTTNLKDLLYNNYEHGRWDDVAERCLSCGNCTMVCPTCFCNTTEDITDLKGQVAERIRRWDSCFTVDFAFIHGGSTRTSSKSRYRQWLTHKLATWQDQFGTIGCVGCGRCITWCPAGIDITEEVRAIQWVEPVCKTCVLSRDKSFETVRRMLAENPIIRDLGDEYLDLITECSSIVRFNPGEFIIRAGEDADRFYLIRFGTVAIETFAPERGAIIVQTIGEGELLGWSWFIPPYKWHFDARAVELTRAIAVEAQLLREECDKDPHLGYLINRYISKVIGQRMEATRMQLLDVYGDHS
jgi:CRP-like cAMP-binding protein